MSESLISIIIPTYNRAHLISETLDSILAQTYINWECIVVDDGSTDNTAAVLAKFIEKDNRFQYYQRPESRKKGPNSCRNYGFEMSKGDYIKWFDSDDIMLSACLEKQIISIGNNADISVCKLMRYDFNKGIGIKENEIYSDNLIEDYLVGNIAFYISGPLWKRNFIIKKEQLLDEKIFNLDDWDFNLRMLYQEPVIVYLDESLILYRIHNSSLSQEIVKSNFTEIKSEFKARRKHLFILIFKKKVKTKKFIRFIITRNKYYLRESLLHKDNCSISLFKNLLLTQFILLDYNGFIKSVLGYFGLKYFNVGYKFFK